MLLITDPFAYISLFPLSDKSRRCNSTRQNKTFNTFEYKISINHFKQSIKIS